MKKLLVIDGNSLMNRAFYGVRPLTTATGLFTNAVFGYVNMLKKHLDQLQPDCAAVAFDVHAPTFRHRMYDQYKAGRRPMPEELKMQVPYIRQVSQILGFHILEKEGYEADDILGTLSARAQEEGMETYIVTGDRDSLQLVSDATTVILASTGADQVYTPQALRERYGVEPAQMIDVKAIMGDSSDNIPGVKGIGEKGALSLIGTFGSLRGVYQNLEDPRIKPAMRQKLIAERETANLSYVLATIDRRVPQLPELKELKKKPLDIQELKQTFTQLEFVRLLHQFLPQEPPAQPEFEQLTLDTVASAAPPPPPREIQRLSKERLAPLLEGHPVYAVLNQDTVTLMCQGQLYTFADPDCFDLFYTENFQNNLVVYSYKELCHFIHRHTGRSLQGVEVGFDALLAGYLVNPSDNITAESLLVIYGKRSPGAQELEDPAYCLQALEQICPVLYDRLEGDGLKELYYRIEMPLAYTLAKMEITGFAVDSPALAEYGAALTTQITALEKQIHDLAGAPFNVNSPKQLGTVLFETLALPAPKKTKTGYPTDAQTLEKLYDQHPIVAKILEYRALAKLNGTYAQGLQKAVSQEDGRIHTRFNQTQTMTGRLSSLEPNLQNIPVRTPLGKELRRFFVAKDPDWVLVDADYSQIELRILAHLSGDQALQEAFRTGQDIHAQTAAKIFRVSPEQVTPAMRKAAKAINFGILYGMGAFSLSQDIGVSTAEAKEYIQEYFAAYPKIQGYLDSLILQGRTNGFVTTYFGRRRYVPELTVSKKNLVAFGERVAKNTPIQGTAADIIKLAMVNVDRRLEKEGLQARLILQVHDELIVEAPKSEAEKAAALLKEEMEHAVKLSVELTADTQLGYSWYDCH